MNTWPFPNKCIGIHLFILSEGINPMNFIHGSYRLKAPEKEYCNHVLSYPIPPETITKQ